MKKIIGILGGMGPAATVDVFNKFVESTKATKDQEHIPLLISSIPDIPDRTEAILNGGKDPFKKMAKYLKKLEDAGAKCIIMPCNTAHFWFDKLKAISKVEMISIIDSAIKELKIRGKKNIGILATYGTLETKLYQNALTENGFTLILSNNQDNVMKSIYTFKAGDLKSAEDLMKEQAKSLFDKGAEVVILGCTEVPIILAKEAKNEPQKYLDATQALVNQAIIWYKEN